MAKVTVDHTQAHRHLRKSDPILAKLIDRVDACAMQPRAGSVFDALLRSIVYQQLSGKAAATIHGRVLAKLPKRSAQQPAAILAIADEELRAAGLSRNKIAAIRDLATHVTGKTIPTRRHTLRMTDEEIIAALVKVRGIGQWTVEMMLMFWLARPDVLPLDDLGIRKGFSVTYGLEGMPTADELLAHGERWRPYRSIASWYLWRAADLAKLKPA